MKNDTQITTLTAKEVEKIATPRKNLCIAISLYLGIRADRDFLAVANSLFSEGGKKLDASKKFSHNDKELAKAIFSDMEKKLRAIKLPDKTRTFIIFFDDKQELKLYKVPVYIPSRLVVEKDLYIHPFIKNLQKYPRYGVLFLERDRAKIFDYFWGEVENETEEIRSDVPQRMNAARASWKGLRESRTLKHIDVHVDWHLKKVADSLDTYVRKNKIPYLVIGSHKELLERFKEHLSSAMREKVIGSYLIRTDRSLKEMREKSMEVIDKFELEKEEDIINRVTQGSSKRKKMAVLGIGSVLQRLAKYEIYTLVIGKKYAPEGCLCPDDHHVYIKKNKSIACKTPTSEISDISDELIELAIAQKIRIIHLLHDHEEFDKFGVGAILK